MPSQKKGIGRFGFAALCGVGCIAVVIFIASTIRNMDEAKKQNAPQPNATQPNATQPNATASGPPLPEQIKTTEAEHNTAPEQTTATTPQPTDNPKTIPGLTAIKFYFNLVNNKGFTQDTVYGKGTLATWTCKGKEAGCDLTAECHGRNAIEIQSATATVMHPNQGDPLPVAKQFLGDMATIPYEGAEPEQAKKWVEDHVGEVADTTINGVKFELKGSQFVRTLIMTPVK
jgi:hypothetical protein